MQSVQATTQKYGYISDDLAEACTEVSQGKMIEKYVFHGFCKGAMYRVCSSRKTASVCPSQPLTAYQNHYL